MAGARRRGLLSWAAGAAVAALVLVASLSCLSSSAWLLPVSPPSQRPVAGRLQNLGAAEDGRPNARGSHNSTGPTDTTAWLRGLVLAAAAGLIVAFVSPSPEPEASPVSLGAPAAWARESRTGSGKKVNRDPVSLLQLALPVEECVGDKNAEPVRLLQSTIEATREATVQRLWTRAEGSVTDGAKLLSRNKKEFVKLATETKRAEAEEVLTQLGEKLSKITKEVGDASADAMGSVKEKEAAKEIIAEVLEAQKLMGDFELLLLPPDYVSPIPQEYQKEAAVLPQLRGRAVVEMTFARPDSDRKFESNDILYDTVNLDVVCDGWAAPLTAGNFVDLADKGFYNGSKVVRADGFVVQAGAGPLDDDKGYRPAPGEPVRRLPLEIGIKGRKQALYGETIDEAGLVRTSSVKIPFQADGTIALGRQEFDYDSGSSQFFFFVFEPDMTPPGKNFMDGRYATFGYTIKGQEFIRQIQEGDVITGAKVISGLDKLVRPS